MFSKQSAKTKIGLFLMTILCAVTLGLSASNSVMASSNIQEYVFNDPRLRQYTRSDTQLAKYCKKHYIPKKYLYVYHVKKGYKGFHIYCWDTKDRRAAMVPQFHIDTKYGGKTVVAVKNSKYDAKFNGVKYRPVRWYHNITGGSSYIKESEFKRIFRKGGTFNDFKAASYTEYLSMKNGKIKHLPSNWNPANAKDYECITQGFEDTRNADIAAFFFGYKNNKSYELLNLATDLQDYYNDDSPYDASDAAKLKARYKKLSGKDFHYMYHCLDNDETRIIDDNDNVINN